MNDVNVQYMLGQIDQRLKAGEDSRTEIKATLETQNEKLDRIVGYIERQKGARRSLLAMGSALAAGFGTVAGLAVQWITSKHG